MAEYYPWIKTAHVWAVLLSGSLFFLRGLAVLLSAAHANHALIRYTSYAIDTALFTAAMMLLVILHLDPLTTPWLAVKLGLLPAYVVLGSLALRRAPTRRAKLLCFSAALICYGLMFGIARAHHPLGWLRWFGWI